MNIILFLNRDLESNLVYNFEVFMGTRDAVVTSSRVKSNPMSGKSFPDWHKANPDVSLVNYQDLPDDTDVFINATGGQGSIAALESVGHAKLEHKSYSGHR